MRLRNIAFGILSVALLGCSSAYFSAMESLGYAKRDLFVKRVKLARESQAESKEEFKSAYERFAAVVRVRGGALEGKYKDLNSQLERAEASANNVHKRVDAVESVADALFDEWKAELNRYSNANLRRASEQKLRDTERRYEPVMRAMRQAESKLEPALTPLRDNVLFLKHNLNAQAIAALGDEQLKVETNVNELLADLDRSIREADEFVSHLQAEQQP